MRKYLAVLLVIITCLCHLTGCGTDRNTGQNTRILTDGARHQVKIPENVSSIVCVGVGALRYACYMGVQDLVVA